MLDHIDLAVSDITVSRTFYEAALAPLDICTHRSEINRVGGTAILMGGDEICFVIGDQERPGEGNHIAFRAIGGGSRCISRGGACRGWSRQRRAGYSRRLRGGLLCCVRARPRRVQRRGGVLPRQHVTGRYRRGMAGQTLIAIGVVRGLRERRAATI